MYRKRLICFLTALVLAVSLCASALALDAGTLKNGSRGEEVRKLQQALITLGYLKGTADGNFGASKRPSLNHATCDFGAPGRSPFRLKSPSARTAMMRSLPSLTVRHGYASR